MSTPPKVICQCGEEMRAEPAQVLWQCYAEHCRNYRPMCPLCCGTCEPNDCVAVFTPIIDCEHKDAVDGCCSHPKNMTPECHISACPRLHPRIKNPPA